MRSYYTPWEDPKGLFFLERRIYMALFKVLRGSSSSLESQPFHDGYAYFTPDDGRFYIDVKLAEAPELYFQVGTEGSDTIYRIEIESATWAALSNTKADKGHQHTIADITALGNILTTGTGSFSQTGTTVNVDLRAD